jgi:hypothetical protein
VSPILLPLSNSCKNGAMPHLASGRAYAGSLSEITTTACSQLFTCFYSGFTHPIASSIMLASELVLIRERK